MVALLHTLIVVVIIHGVSVSRMMNLGVLQLVVPDGVHSSAAGTAGPKLADIVRPPPPEPTGDGEAAPGAGAGLGAGAGGSGGGAAAAAVAVATAFADNIATESVDTGALVPSAESIAWAATAGRIRSHDSGFAWSKAVYTMNSGLTSTPSALRALEADKDLADDDDDDDDNDGGKATAETAAMPAPISMAAPPVPGGAPSSPLVISDNDESDTETDEDEDDEDDSSDSDTGEVVAPTAVKVADA